MSLHEVMEQQTVRSASCCHLSAASSFELTCQPVLQVSVAKAGIVASLPARTAVLAACACPVSSPSTS